MTISNGNSSKKIKRLFITTGLISLINAEAIIKNLDNTNAENYLIICTSIYKKEFEDFNKRLILPEYFNSVDFCYEYDGTISLNNIDTPEYIKEFDEIYTTAQYHYKNIFKHTKIYLIEEGISSYFDMDNINYDNVQNIYLSEYLGKIKYQNIDRESKVKLLNKDDIKFVIEQIRQKNNINVSHLKQDNQVLMLSQYIYNQIMSNEDVVDFYKSYIDILLESGYNVLFKSHPRFSDKTINTLKEIYKSDNRFQIFPEDIKYPVELLIPDLDLKAIVTSMSGGAFNCAHLYNIPCYGFGAKLMNHPSEYIMKYKNIFLNYLPHISEFITDYRWKKINAQLGLDKVPKFTQIRLETTNNCGYHCFMCPRAKMTRPIGKMSIEDLKLVLDKLDFIKYELDFHMHGYGEAFICDDLPERCKIVTSKKPNFTPLIYTTLGYKKDKEWIESLFANGLGKVVVSLYGYDKKTYQAVHGVDRFEIVKENLEFIANLRDKYGFKLSVCLDDFKDKYPLPKFYSKHKLYKLKQKFIKYLHSLNIYDISGQILHNFGDGFDDLSTIKKTVPCSICWGNRRQHLSISWDLNIHPCAYDYDCTVIWGNLRHSSLEEIYKSKAHLDFIKSLLHLNNSEYKQPAICSTSSCFPNETNHEKEYNIIAKYWRI